MHPSPAVPGSEDAIAKSIAPATAASTAEAIQSAWWIAPFYFAGVVSTVYHLANGIWTALITWGITIRPRSQQVSGYVFTALGTVLSVVGVAALDGLRAVGAEFAVDGGGRVEAEAVLREAAGADRKLIERAAVFDVFAGAKAVEQFGEGRKSVAISVRLQPTAGTLTEAEIEAVAARVVAAEAKATGGTLRSGAATDRKRQSVFRPDGIRPDALSFLLHAILLHAISESQNEVIWLEIALAQA